ncbi:MAG: hypothetical protein NC206_07425 [Bacteroides sp.]|nr:hypothetical protein [Roseburia sp.]MCM1346902.1 hypothetical protein [Bacteroides sp.]MCM1421434.1 hypothetical protein [Bacteroides sp.]
MEKGNRIQKNNDTPAGLSNVPLIPEACIPLVAISKTIKTTSMMNMTHAAILKFGIKETQERDTALLFLLYAINMTNRKKVMRL